MSKQDKKRMIATLAMVLAATQFGGSLTYAQTDLSLLTEEELVRFHNSIIQDEKNQYDTQIQDVFPEEQEEVEETEEQEEVEETEEQNEQAEEEQQEEQAETEQQEEKSDEQEVDAVAERAGETEVRTTDEFLNALKNTSVNTIVVAKRITVVNTENAGTDMDLTPIEIPANKTIKGNGANSILTFRGPIQLTGDNVKFQDIELNFISSDAMGSVPHREIFLAGHSLTLDNVECYTQGAEGNLGGFGSSEAELLPEVYAGGYRNATLGNHAQLTVQNANSKTMFKTIYAGHDKGQYGMEAYQGQVTLSLDAKTVVRDGIFADNNTGTVEITFKGENTASVRSGMKVFGNTQTTVNFDNVSASGVVVDGVEQINLSHGAVFEPEAGNHGAVIQNISVPDGTTLDLHSMNGTVVEGDFAGGGILKLDVNDTLRIHGNITGTTKFHTGKMTSTPGELKENKAYIVASGQTAEGSFILADGYQSQGYKIVYANNQWSVQKSGDRELKSMEIVSGPSVIFQNELNETDSAHYQYTIKGKDKNNVEYVPTTIDGVLVSANDFLDDSKTDWYQGVDLEPGDEYEKGIYYLYSIHAEDDKLPAGSYYLIVMGEAFEHDDTSPITIGELKKIEKARMEIEVLKNPENVESLINLENKHPNIEIEQQRYTGQQMKPEVTVTVDNQTLVKGTDFIVNYENNTNVTSDKNKAIAKITGIGKYTGTVTKEFDIIKGEAEVGLSTDKNTYTYGDKVTFTFTAQPKKQGRRSGRSVPLHEVEFVYVNNGEEQVLGKSYVTNGKATFVYDTKKNIIKPSTAQIKVRYGGSDSLESQEKENATTITLNKKNIDKTDIQKVQLEDIVYDGKTKETKIKAVTWKDETLNDVYVTGNATFQNVNAGDITQANIKDLEIVGEQANWYTLSATSYHDVQASGKILKAEAPNNVHDTQIIQLNGGTLEHSIDFSQYLPKDTVVTEVKVGTISENDKKLLNGDPVIEQNKTLKFTRKQVSEKSEFSIPIIVSFQNQEDMEIKYHFIVTDEVKVDLQLQAPNMVYSGQAYDAWSIQNANKDDLNVTYHDVTKNQTLGSTAPTNVGKYRINVKLNKENKIGEASQEFAITPKAVTVTAKSKTIKVGTTPTDLKNPQLGTDYEVSDGVQNVGKIVMWYDKTLNIQNPTVGTYDINIGILPEKENPNYKATFVPGSLQVTSGDVPTPPEETKHRIMVTNGTATINGQHVTEAKENDVVTITAEKPQAGMVFAGWKVKKGDVKLTDATQEVTTFTMPAKEVEIEATYKKEEVVQEYTIQVTGGHASVNGATVTKAKENQEITITADVPEGKRFVRWNVTAGDVTLTNPAEKQTTFTMPAAAVSIEAVYETEEVAQEYAIQVTGGHASAEKATAGQEITITADVPQGKRFVRWNVTAGDVTLTNPAEKQTTFTMPAAAVSIEAVYETEEVAQEYTIQVTGGHASAEKATAGQEITITADVPQGKRFVRWNVTAGDVTLTNPAEKQTTFTMPAAAVSIEAVYETEEVAQEYAIQVTAGHASVHGETVTKAKANDVVTITANDPEDGKKFAGWTGNVNFADATKSQTTFVMPQNAVNITANYKDKDDVSAVERVELSSQNMSIRLGTTTELTATVFPQEASNKAVTWTISNDIAEIKAVDGKENTVQVVAKRTGNAVITVTTEDGNHTATCELNVYRKSSGGGGGGSSSHKPSNTNKNPDGSQTTTTQNKDGQTMEVTKHENGAVETVVKEKDGTITNTQTKPDGTKTETTFTPDGKINATVTLPEKSEQHGTTGKAETQKVTIPDVPKNMGLVAAVVDENGNKQVIKYSYVSEDGMVVALNQDAKIEIYDNSKTFKDVPQQSPYKEAVDFVTSHELFFGTKKDKFSPETSMTRAMFAEVMYRLEDRPTTTNGVVFNDVKKSDYFANAVAWASEKGIINGMGNGKFVPNKPITKQELLVMLHQLSEDKGDTKTENKQEVNLQNVSAWAAESVDWAVQNKIVTTDHNGMVSKPDAFVSRAEVATILLHYVTK